MKYTHVFLGKARTGTTSIWRMYRDHPQVAPSKEKDYLYSNQDINQYVNNAFMIRKRTKVLFEGTNDFYPGYMHLLFGVQQLNEIGRMCCIYTLRDPKERLISLFNLLNKMKRIGKFERQNYFHREDGSLNYDGLKLGVLLNVQQFKYLKMIESITGKDNILVVKLEDIQEKQEKIHDFLEIDNINLKFPKRHATIDITPTIDQVKTKAQIIKFMDDFYDENVSSIAEEQLQLIYERYKVV